MLETTILEVLKYIFEIYTQQSADLPLPELDELTELLQKAGFTHEAIEQAFSWLQHLAQETKIGLPPRKPSTKSHRIYSPEEMLLLDPSCRGLLLRLEQLDIIDPLMREHIIERALDFDVDDLNLNTFKHIILTVLASRSSLKWPGTWFAHILFSEKAYD